MAVEKPHSVEAIAASVNVRSTCMTVAVHTAADYHRAVPEPENTAVQRYPRVEFKRPDRNVMGRNEKEERCQRVEGGGIMMNTEIVRTVQNL